MAYTLTFRPLAMGGNFADNAMIRMNCMLRDVEPSTPSTAVSVHSNEMFGVGPAVEVFCDAR